MRNVRKGLLRSAALAGLLGCGGIALAQQGLSSPGQAQLGREAYVQNCASCHGTELVNGQFAPALKGPGFLAKWGGTPLTELLEYMHRSMPPANPGGLADGTYAALAAFILHENGGGEADLAVLPTAPPLARRESAVGGLSERLYPLPAGPTIPDRFADYTPVTQAELANPAPEDWPAWRRSHLGLGYSPLRQIDTSNVDRLRIAFGRTNQPIEFDAIDDNATRFFFLIVAPPLEVSNQYLPVLGKIAQFSKEPDVPERMLGLTAPGQFMDLLKEKGV